MPKLPVHAPRSRVVKAFEEWGFQIVREREHISMVRENPDGSRTTLTMPNHDHVKESTIRTICTRAGIARDDFLDAYQAS